MKLRGKILVAGALILAAAILVPLIHHHRMRAALENYLSQLKADGAPLEWSQVIPKPVPPDQNGALLVSNAFSLFISGDNFTNSIAFNNDPADMNISILPGKRIVGWRQPVIHDPSGNYPTNTWHELGRQLTGSNPLDDLRKLIARPALDFNLDYRNETADRHLAMLLSGAKYATEWLRASSLYNLHQGNTAAACEDVRAMLALVKGESVGHLYICQLVRFALAQMNADGTWEVLQSPDVSEKCLAQLQHDWQSLTFIQPLRESFLLERVQVLHFANRLRHSQTNAYNWVIAPTLPQIGYKYKKIVTGTSPRWILVDESSFMKRFFHKISVPCDVARWRWFWSYADEIRSLQTIQMGISAMEMTETNRSFHIVGSWIKTNVDRLDFDSLTNSRFAFFSRWYHPLTALRKLMTVKTEQNIVVTAIALKRYELRHHALPDKLDQLVPKLLKSIPIDYMNGQPLHYRANADGTFLLYSVGENGKDDGGNPAWHKLSKYMEISDYYWDDDRALDWVWPQPATAAEIKAYYKEQAKNSN